jgi:FkbM family methyltransferase
MMTPRNLSWVLAATEHGPMIVNRHDRVMIDETHGYGVGFQLLELGSYDLDEVYHVHMLLHQLRKERGDGVIVLDCGANIGVMTVEWARHMIGWGAVLAVEPQEPVFYALCGNIALNNLPNARALNAAVGRGDGEIKVPALNFNVHGSYGSLGLMGGHPNDVGQVPDRAYLIPLRKIDDIVPDPQRVDFIKLDVEGMELDALQGASKTIARCRPVLLVEHLKNDKGQLRSAIAGLGYDVSEQGQNNFLGMPV